MQPCKNGFFYMLDAATGKLLRADAVHGGELGRRRGHEDRSSARETGSALFPVGKPFNLAPGVQGAHGWQGERVSAPTRGLHLHPDAARVFPDGGGSELQAEPGRLQPRHGFRRAVHLLPRPPGGEERLHRLSAGVGPGDRQAGLEERDERGSARAARSRRPAGSCSRAAVPAKEFRAFDAKTGEKLWSVEDADGRHWPRRSPIELDGKQYIAVSVGGAAEGGYYAPNYSRMLVFTLNGQAALPPDAAVHAAAASNPPPEHRTSAEVVKTGGGVIRQVLRRVPWRPGRRPAARTSRT